MTPRDEFVAVRLEKARRAFGDGLFLLEKGSWDAAINRFYYASFHAARALLATRDRISKSHAAMIGVFHDEFVKPGGFDRDSARALSRGFEKRQKSDYSDLSESSREDAESARDDAAAFIAECERLLRP